MTFRFAAPELLALGRPPSLAASPYETLLEASRVKLVADMAAAGIEYDVSRLETDPGMIVTQGGVYRDLLRRYAIDDSIAQTYLGSATGVFLDRRAADYGVLRRVIDPGDATASPPRDPITEGDDSLRRRARMAWEALSVAGPAGAYVFHALDAHPLVLDAAAYGPESGLVDPGEVLVVVQSSAGDTVPDYDVLTAIAERLDAYAVIDGDGVSTLRTVRDSFAVRPLGARVTVKAVAPVAFNVTATLAMSPGNDSVALVDLARANLTAYLARRRGIGTEIPRSALISALHVADAGGIPVLEEVTLVAPAADVTPAFDEVGVLGTVTLTVELRQ